MKSTPTSEENLKLSHYRIGYLVAAMDYQLPELLNAEIIPEASFVLRPDHPKDGVTVLDQIEPMLSPF